MNYWKYTANKKLSMGLHGDGSPRYQKTTYQLLQTVMNEVFEKTKYI
jgi:hypothetical protein